MASTFINAALSLSIVLSTLAPSHASILQKRAVIVGTPPTPWTYAGCWTEAADGRALSGSSYASGTAMTEESCIAFCGGKGAAWAGIEYGSECYCGNILDSTSAAAPAGDCNMACSGNATEACGAGNRLTLFKNPNVKPAGAPVHNPGPAGWTGLGCYTDGANGRALANGVATTGGGGALTVALCASACKSANYQYAGVEYAGECYCANSIGGDNGPAADGLKGCNMPCNGNATEYCGGPNRLDMYKYGGGTGTDPSTTTTKPPTSTGAGSATGLPTGWGYKGCYVDNANGRILNVQKPDSQTLTIESCVAACVASGYTVAGMEYSTQCFCGNSITNGGVIANADTDCATTCGGNNKEQCGGPNRMSIYARGALAVAGAPGPQKSGLPGSWTYKGCISEGTNDRRIWKYQIINPTGNTATSCLNQCARFGFMAGGMEYGEECYCGDIDEIETNGGAVAKETDCGVPCPGNNDYLCGGGNRLTWYQWTGTPLYKWSYPKGNGAGSYSLLIGGVCIPLLTTPGVNGKYQFVEKFGTGEPNSTGAYELDLTYQNDISKAWRPMHVKTDVFCSASLTLPDKVGRQINIGGWSGDSLFGIRLYWPDGSPGTASTNDWQENVNELKLQIGRWYPSAMVMTNGSILIVGGENGSNGPPQPSLEILPKPAGGNTVVTLDFLQRTDPYNLYPFLFVVPSGIVIGYYNEMRILDEVTFATKKMLPNMPGIVNDPAAGRTYPLEGTAMLMPQYAPFSDPLTVLICGGSTNGNGLASDNCISTQPEAANPQWTIERMPSQRVISCMTALPDGTYMILNGAHQGQAGFGLATSPNLNAVLYDPSKPVNQRMSIMANTTVARLYHSEAILMQDGRVMVSGSDPQDGTHPEEYRVEVFTPPYRMPGTPAPPTFTVANKDWTYGASITVQITSGALANPRASLMGAESSTHGNSMGQRTLFPAIACAGATCTITVPPNKYVCPMGWFQLFILNGPTPSKSTWIRIGGDPGKLGNWPNSPNFKTPGV